MSVSNYKFLTSIRTLILRRIVAFVISLLVVVGGALLIAYLKTTGFKIDDKAYSYIIIILAGLLVIIVVVLLISIIQLYNLCYKGLFETSRDLVEDISANKQTFGRFPNNRAKEFEDLNNALDKAEEHLSRSVIYSRDADYSSLDLKVSNEKLGTIQYDSFVENIPEIVMLSGAFRNAFVHISYGEKLTDLLGQSDLEAMKAIRRIFDYEFMLIADDADLTGYIIYIPQIDSMNRLEEECEMLIKSSSMVKNTPNGKAIVLARASIVLFPYSEVEDIISDLRYADRQGMNINVYLPERSNKSNNDTTVHGSFALNCSNQLVSNLAAVKIHDRNGPDVKETIRTSLKKFAAFINADYAGVIMRDDRINRFINYISVNNRNEVFLKEDEMATSELLDLTYEVADKDGSYFFSSRSHLNSKLGNYLDKANLNAGFLYLVADDNGPLGLVYFLNYQREMNLNSYLHESAFSISYEVGSIIRESNQLSRLKSSTERTDVLMKLSNYMLYAIDKNTFEITYASETMQDSFGKIAKKTCYRAIYGLNKPCEECPIVSQKKMIKPHKNINYETSLVLNTTAENVSRMLMKRLDKEGEDHNRFDPDFLINSYYSLNEDLYNIYSVSGRGNVILLGIVNYKELLEKYGNEGYVRYIRKLTDHINERFEKDNKFYLYDNSKIALIVPDSGNTEIIDICEKIYNFSREPFIDIDNQEFIPVQMNYIDIKYPQEFPTHSDLLRHVENVFANYKQKDHIDEIYFEGTDYYRSASHTEFINEVIDKSFKEGSFKVNLQPILHSITKHIVGAEILIRLSDDYRGQALSAYEVIKVAAEQHKIGFISDALINYIGDIYQKYGLTLFKTREFTRLSLNTDYSYFSDENFLKKISQLVATYNFPKNFLAFEIVESELSEHYDTFKTICGKLKMIGVHLAVDQYTGRHLSLEKIKALDIPEIKIARNMVKDVDVSKSSLTALSELVKEATSIGLQASVVGVENKDQYFLIRDMSKESLMQGFFFYAPLELPQLIEAVKIN